MNINKSGFTIVELLIVIVIIAILAAISIVSYTGIQNRANVSASKASASAVQKKMESYHSVTGQYPSANVTSDLARHVESSLDSGITIAGPHPNVRPNAANGTTAIKVDVCSNPAGSGYLVYYWDYGNTNTTQRFAFGGSVGANGVNCRGWLSAQ